MDSALGTMVRNFSMLKVRPRMVLRRWRNRTGPGDRGADGDGDAEHEGREQHHRQRGQHGVQRPLEETRGPGVGARAEQQRRFVGDFVEGDLGDGRAQEVRQQPGFDAFGFALLQAGFDPAIGQIAGQEDDGVHHAGVQHVGEAFQDTGHVQAGGSGSRRAAGSRRFRKTGHAGDCAASRRPRRPGRGCRRAAGAGGVRGAAGRVADRGRAGKWRRWNTGSGCRGWCGAPCGVSSHRAGPAGRRDSASRLWRSAQRRPATGR